MKFWELISSFRTEKENLQKVLSNQKWVTYKLCYDKIDKTQNFTDRELLDKEIPLELGKEVCELSKLRFFLHFKEKPHILRLNQLGSSENYEIVSPLDILLRFGGTYIEETLEYGSARVFTRELGQDIEVLGAFNLNKIGMVAFLRSNNNLSKKDTLYSNDDLRAWVIVEEHFPFVTPSSASEKIERQKQQGIRQYILEPLIGSDKPKDTELLRRKSND